MAKAPQPGRSKTRLCPPLSPEQCAVVSAAFLRDTVENLVLAAGQSAITPYAAYAPSGTEDLLRHLIGADIGLLLADGVMAAPPGVEGFGRCLLQATQAMLALGHPAACVLSSDIPTLPTRLLTEATDSLLSPGDHAVLGATHDGGYYILGLKAAHAHMFAGITWSTDRVADETRQRAREAGLKLVELDPWYDVDDAVSLDMLLAEDAGYAAPHTRGLLAQLNLHPQASPVEVAR
jgi:glycosyltransferase A (GT-A) superfamily protein (DUF2064 family)